ncbi:MAG: hypothetical protein DMG31_00390 [Acidobacteria bacterium]|nr:MAG: hypothetical protein DMG31_00390 [Acidobacteriota bacterium]
MSNAVYLLWFVRAGLKIEDVEMLIGVYSNEEEAKSAIQRLCEKPGFAEFPQGFQIVSYELDRDHWVEGFKFVE